MLGGLSPFGLERTEALLKAVKKTNFTVKGDPLLNLLRSSPQSLVLPVSEIYNAINTTRSGRVHEKKEHLTIIPKNPNPAYLSKCRNISCTSIFSMILEGQVLLKLRSKLITNPHQYGGIPRCSTEHMLIKLSEQILDALEGGKDAAILLGVNYKKAFNRMDHGVCLRKLKELGSLECSLVLVKAFLEDRCMTITIRLWQSFIHKIWPRGQHHGSGVCSTS